MIKLNLLPQYVIEYRRIRVLAVFFVIILALEGGVVIKAYLDLKQQAAWFTTDKAYFDGRKTMIKAEVDEASKWKDNAGKYGDLITFLKRDAVVKYNNDLVKSLAEAAGQVGGAKQAWFTDMTIAGTAVTYHGKIKGLMNFLEFYFHMEDQSFTVAPGGEPAQDQKVNTLNREIDLTVSGTVKDGLPDPPKGPDGKSFTELYIPYAEPAATKSPASAAGAPPAAGKGHKPK